MQHGITVLNFDQTYREQSFLQGMNCKWLNFEDVRGTNLLCEVNSLKQIAAKLQSVKDSSITFIGSGNYHYISYLLLSKIKRPFTLLLFDHHTDMLPSPSSSLISCGSWVMDALRDNKLLQKVIMIGTAKEWINQIPKSLRKRVAIHDEPQLQENYNSAVHAVVDEIATDSVYISVDKDVLSPHDAATRWDQGSMSLEQLVEMMDEVAAYKKICGVDVCGEYPLAPSERYLKHGREALAINDHANSIILEHAKAASLTQ